MHVSLDMGVVLGMSAYLEAADESIGHVIFEEVSSLVVYAGPTPHVFA
jgi:hypothetical protein